MNKKNRSAYQRHVNPFGSEKKTTWTSQAAANDQTQDPILGDYYRRAVQQRCTFGDPSKRGRSGQEDTDEQNAVKEGRVCITRPVAEMPVDTRPDPADDIDVIPDPVGSLYEDHDSSRGEPDNPNPFDKRVEAMSQSLVVLDNVRRSLPKAKPAHRNTAQPRAPSGKRRGHKS